MTSITDRIEIQLDAGSTEVVLTRAEAVEVATRLHRQSAEPGRCSCGADAYCTDVLSNGFRDDALIVAWDAATGPRVRSAQPGPAWKGRQGVRRLPVLAGPALTRGAR